MAFAAGQADRLYESALFRDGAAAFGWGYWILATGIFLSGCGIALFGRLKPWRGLVAIGLLQTILVSLVIVPRVFEVYQGPVKEAALLARAEDKTVVRYLAFQPSFSLYRGAIVEQRPPVVGEWVLVRIDNLDRFAEQYPQFETRMVYARGPTRLLEVLGVREVDG